MQKPETATRGPRAGKYQGLTFYRETETGDYLVVQGNPNYFGWGNRKYEGRAVALVGQPNSASTTTISTEYLKRSCKRVSVKDVPKEWLDWLVGDE